MDKPALLMTRPAATSAAFIGALDARVMAGVQVVISPLFNIVPTGARPDFTAYRGVIFTSARAVDLAGGSRGKAAYCVGARTAEAASQAGWDVRFCAADAAALIPRLLDPSIAPLLHLCGRHRRGQIAETLCAAGVKTDVEVLYDQQSHPLSSEAHDLLSRAGPVIAPVFSPRTALLLVQHEVSLQNVTAVALSPAVATELRDRGLARIIVTPQPSGKEMADAVEKLLRHSSLP